MQRNFYTIMCQKFPMERHVWRHGSLFNSLAPVPDHPVVFLSTQKVAQKSSIIWGPRDPLSSSGLCKECMHMVQRHPSRQEEWDWSYRWLWTAQQGCYESNSGPLSERSIQLITESSLKLNLVLSSLVLLFCLLCADKIIFGSADMSYFTLNTSCPLFLVLVDFNVSFEDS